MKMMFVNKFQVRKKLSRVPTYRNLPKSSLINCKRITCRKNAGHTIRAEQNIECKQKNPFLFGINYLTISFKTKDLKLIAALR